MLHSVNDHSPSEQLQLRIRMRPLSAFATREAAIADSVIPYAPVQYTEAGD